MNSMILIFIISIVLPFILIWLYIFSKKEKRILSFNHLALAFIVGLLLAGVIAFVEKLLMDYSIGILGKFLNVFAESKEEFLMNWKNLVFISFINSFGAALLETWIQYIFLKSYIEKEESVNKALYGVQLGIFLGFGFVLVKNLFHSSQFSAIQLPEKLLIFQSLLGSFVYPLYAGLLAYFLTMSKFHRLYKDQFIKKGVTVSLILYFVANFILSGQIFYYTFWIEIIILGVLIKYLVERRDFELNLIERKKVLPPFWHEKKEVITFLFNEKLSYYEMKRLAFCPNCFIVKKEEWKTCPYCGMRFE